MGQFNGIDKNTIIFAKKNLRGTIENSKPDINYKMVLLYSDTITTEGIIQENFNLKVNYEIFLFSVKRTPSQHFLKRKLMFTELLIFVSPK